MSSPTLRRTGTFRPGEWFFFRPTWGNAEGSALAGYERLARIGSPS